MVRGFTLIEMMVVVAITGIIATGGIVAYSRYRDRTEIQTDANAVVARLRKIQATAAAVEAPNLGCSGAVTGFTVAMAGSNMTVTINCGTAVTRADLGLSLGNSKFRTSYSVVFSSPQIGATPTTVDICNANTDYQFTINSLAGISAPVAASPLGPPCP